MSEKKRNLAWLEAESHKQNRRARRRDIEHPARSQLLQLRARLLKLGVVELGDVAEKAKGNWHHDPKTGEIRVWFVIDGCAYSAIGSSDGPIFVEQKANGMYEWTVLDQDGKPTTAWFSPRWSARRPMRAGTGH